MYKGGCVSEGMSIPAAATGAGSWGPKESISIGIATGGADAVAYPETATMGCPGLVAPRRAWKSREAGFSCNHR